MRVPVSWLRELVVLPVELGGRELSAAIVALGLEVETVQTVGEVSGPIVVGRVEEIVELTEFKKPIRMCQLFVGPDFGGVRGIVCGASNFEVDDLVLVALPGAILVGGFEITARQTYGQVSDGMICSARELGLGDEYDGIIVLPAEISSPGTAAIGVPGLGLGEEVLDIAVTPDRGYALSIRGVAREAAIACQVPFDDPGTTLASLPLPDGTGEPVNCTSQDLTACDVFTLRTLTGVNAGAPTPMWMKQRLIAAGMRPISIIVDVTNYVMIELGQPLHAFDAHKLTGSLTARRASSGEELTTLDHIERKLSPEDLVIADESGPLALAGTMGGLSSEIDDATTSIVLEAAHFDDVVVARMARRHKLSTEASRRFERGVDRALAPYASDRAASLLIELAGGRNVGLTGVEGPHDSVVINLPADQPGAVAGMSISADQVEQSLVAVGCDVIVLDQTDTGDGLLFKVTAPTWRADLRDPVDLVEEVIRLIGYDLVPSKLPLAPAGGGLSPDQQLRRRAGRIAAGAGLVETLAYPFLGEPDLTKSGIEVGDPRRNLVRLANPISEEQPAMRTTLLPGLFAIAQRNLSRGAESVAIFEAGSVYFPAADPAAIAPRPSVTQRPTKDELAQIAGAVPVQPRHLAGLLSGPWERPGWWGPGRIAEWSDAIEMARRIIAELGARMQVAPGRDGPFHPGRTASLMIDGVSIGFAGELHPRVTAAWGLAPRTVAFEFDLDAVTTAVADQTNSAPVLRTMPVAKEDVALVVPARTPAADVERALREGAGDLLESVRLFDVYAGPQIGEGLKSLAFSLRFRAADRTLEVAELSAARNAAVARAGAATGAVLRAPTTS